jgi:hypothetical protein
MNELYRDVIISNDDYARLVAAEKELKMIRRLLQKKLNSYGGFNHMELEDLCTMLGMRMEEEN